MKKNFVTIILMAAGLLCSLTSCGFSSGSEIKELANNFFTAAKNADHTTVSSYATTEVLTSMGLTALDVASACEHYYEHHNIDASILSRETQDSVTDYCTYFAQNLIQDYQILDTSYENQIGTVNATITTYSTEATEYMESDAFLTELSDLMNAYQNEHIEELSSVYLKEGADAMEEAFYNAVIPLIMDHYKTTLSRFGTEKISLTLTIEKQADLWLITECSRPE